MDCIFCKIAAGELPSKKVYEDGDALVFMDIAGDVDGHMVAIPKRHAENILDCGEDDLCKVMHAVKTVAGHLVKRCGYDGVNLLNANGASAGQSVPHLHFHIIPRKSGDGVNAWPPFCGATSSIDDVWKKIKL